MKIFHIDAWNTTIFTRILIYIYKDKSSNLWLDMVVVVVVVLLLLIIQILCISGVALYIARTP